uniref:HMG box domain-containing protein n=1 Tax=Schizophyllum commune (strain H4-8 / FGSC 9210) TaxID=578458 RepID=D8PRL5_SCHCM
MNPNAPSTPDVPQPELQLLPQDQQQQQFPPQLQPQPQHQVHLQPQQHQLLQQLQQPPPQLQQPIPPQLQCRTPQMVPQYDFFPGFPGEPGPGLPPPPPDQAYRGFHPYPPHPMYHPMPFHIPPQPMMARSARGAERYYPHFPYPRRAPHPYAPYPPPFYFPRPPPPYMHSLPPGPLPAQARRAAKKPHVPRPPNAFMLFRSDYLRKTQHSEKRQQHLSRLAGEEWHKLEEEERTKWMELAASVAQKHSEEHPTYRFTPAPRAGGVPVPGEGADPVAIAATSSGSGSAKATKPSSRRRARDGDDDEYVESSRKRRRRHSPKSPTEASSSGGDSPQIISPTLEGARSSSALPPLRPTLPPPPPLDIDPPNPTPEVPRMLGPTIPYHHPVQPANTLRRRPSTATGIRPGDEKPKADDVFAQPVLDRPLSATDYDSLKRQSISQERRGSNSGLLAYPPLGFDFTSNGGFDFSLANAWAPLSVPVGNGDLGDVDFLMGTNFNNYGFDTLWPAEHAPTDSGSQQPQFPEHSPAE